MDHAILTCKYLVPYLNFLYYLTYELNVKGLQDADNVRTCRAILDYKKMHPSGHESKLHGTRLAEPREHFEP